jgi:hypothetical protein
MSISMCFQMIACNRRIDRRALHSGRASVGEGVGADTAREENVAAGPVSQDLRCSRRSEGRLRGLESIRENMKRKLHPCKAFISKEAAEPKEPKAKAEKKKSKVEPNCVWKCLESIPWPACDSRNNVTPDKATFIEAFPVSTVTLVCCGGHHLKPPKTVVSPFQTEHWKSTLFPLCTSFSVLGRGPSWTAAHPHRCKSVK